MSRRGGTKHCCWGLCNSDSRYPERLTEGTFFIPFPKPGKIRDKMTVLERELAELRTHKAKRWQLLCSRSRFQSLDQITRSTYICSLHFVGGKGPRSDNDEPVLATLTESELTKKPRAKRTGVPDDPVHHSRKRLLLSPEAQDEESTSFPEPMEDDTKTEETTEQDEDGSSESDLKDNIKTEEIEEQVFESRSPDARTVETCEKATQTIYSKYELGAKIESAILRNAEALKEQGKGRSVNGIDPSVVLKDRTKAKYLIGLFPEQFEALFSFLGPAKHCLRYWGSKGQTTEAKMLEKDRRGPSRRFTPKEELFLTLLRLKRGFSLKTIAYMFDISVSSIGKIFNTWINFMFLHFKSMNVPVFPSKDIIKMSSAGERCSIDNVRCFVDCIEFSCATPRDGGQRGRVFSSSKQRTTVKALLAVTPNGAVCFVSDLYGGSASDDHIFEKCGILQHIEPGDVLLLDKGFSVQDLLQSRQATAQTPTFLRQRTNPKAAAKTTMRVAQARVHVERFRKRLQKFALLGRTIPRHLCPIASQTVYVGCCLVNFQENLSI